MKRLSVCVAVVVGLLILTPTLRAAPPLSTPLQVGSAFPTFSGQTVTAHEITLPGNSAEKPTVLVFSFSRTAGKDARLWNESLAKDFPENVSTFGVIQLESAPNLFRRLAISEIKSSMPVPVQNRTVVLYRDDQLWRQRLGVKDESRAYVVLLDRFGTICWMNSVPFSNSIYGFLKAKALALLEPHS